MKKIVLFLLGLISLSFVGCEDDKYFTSFSSSSDLEGIWVCVDTNDYYGMSFEFSEKEITYMWYKGGIIDDDIYYYEIITGDILNGTTMVYEFDKQTQTIYASGVNAGTVNRLGKNKMFFNSNFWMLHGGLYQRVKKIEPKGWIDIIETNPDTPYNSNAKNGTLPGKFTINAQGRQVQFSQGNLQYKASTQKWRFAVQQYYYVGKKNQNITNTHDGWIDLFGWGTGNNPTNASTNETAYSTFVDWGVNKILNGGNTANQWRTLTKEEWEYLFHGRTDADKLFAFGSVNGTNGVILLPDS